MSGHPYAAVVFDYGGVLTSPLGDALQVWCDADGIDRSLADSVVREMYRESSSPVHQLETGALAAADFEALLARRLHSAGAQEVEADGLLGRMLGDFRSEGSMLELLLSLRSQGLKTALLSNSWGMDYPREGWDDLFDKTVISGEVGMRKPDREIFDHTAKLLGVQPAACIFVDDLAHNVRGAAATGMTGIHHVDPETTRLELEALLGRTLL